MRRFKTLTKEILKEGSGINSGMVEKFIALKEWYLLWSANMDALFVNIKEVSTQELWGEFMVEREKAKYKTAEKSRRSKKKKKKPK
eukprot:5080950-Ditylum_brightwellii.AAC.1